MISPDRIFQNYLSLADTPFSLSYLSRVLDKPAAHFYLINSPSLCSQHINMVILRDLLLQPALPDGTGSFHTLQGADKPSLSKKNWAESYHEVLALQLFVNPPREHIDIAFGGEDALDEHLLNRDMNPLNGTTEWFQSEGDSVRTFYTNVSHPIQLAFQTHHGTPLIVQRSESGPLGQTNVTQTIDFTWGCEERCLMIGELKRHGIVDLETWTGTKETDRNRRWLGKELRGYCHKYNCFAASVFDGRYLLILVFHARTVEHIQRQDCEVIGLLFESKCATLRYGLFRTVTHQIRRMQAAAAPAVTLGGYVRKFSWKSGDPYWVNGNEKHGAHPGGYIQMFNLYGAWFWAYQDGSPVLDYNGNMVWDTVSLGL
ncbi:hypothetical protein N658DRAFT_99972 [Parathielavia hyrcaniae]|uniref:Uncharacterized protein n=1 Tax=Parathielavia hyrcaniae TaxID=113614 RepID=A0AAN6PUS6_9PEZI|nr:hypothetical protein N658DRAFT_99972 [Parathielavia hyrcaniae]